MPSKAKLSDYQNGFKNALRGMGVSEAEAERVALNQRDPETPPERFRRTLSHVEIPVTPKRKSDITPGPSPKRRRPGDDDDVMNNMSRLRTHSTPSLPSSSKRRLFKRQSPPASSRPSPTPSDTVTILDDEPFVISDEDNSDSDEEDRPTVSQRSSSDSIKKADFKIVLTPTVYEIVKDFFRNEFIVQPDRSGRSRMANSPKPKSHLEDPVSMRWGNVLQKEDERIFYRNITMDGERYEVGDVVMVKPGDDWNRGRQKNYHAGASQSLNVFANQYWFIEISYFFQESNEKMFHGRWLEHGSKTFLQEVAHSKALFLTNTCDDVALSSIFQKVKVWFHRSNQPEPEDDQDDKGHTFFCEYLWDSVGFVDLPREEDIERDLEQYPLPHQACHSCIIAEMLDAKRLIRHTKGCISQYDIDYHVHDFVYVKPRANDGGVLGIAQIIAISDQSSSQPSLKVSFLRRMGNRPGSSFVEEKLLCFSTTTNTIPFKDIYGKVYVESFPSESREDVVDWSQHDDHFYMLSEISQCLECMEKHQQDLDKTDEFLARVEPLRGLELFSGAGGLSTGLNSSKFVKTVGAVEWDVHAAETYAANHPDTTVYCQEINEVLQHAIDSHEADGDVPSLRSRRGGFCKDLPTEIDLISGGPPCQAFSGANHNPRADDMRATLPFTMISFLELYHSRYFLLENVSGILRFRLMGEMGETKRSIVAGVKQGVFKLIVRCLLALGYQVRTKVLQAANYGSPQGRERVIFWGAKHGNQIPNFPIPTHVYLAKEYNILEHPDLKLTRPTRSLDPEMSHSFAPFKAVTVNDAIGDLPGFDWQNPHIILQATANEKEEERIREKMFPSYPATSGDSPGWKAGDYAHEPLNSYQELMREGMCDSVEEHVTPVFSAGIVERSVMVPLMPGAHHKGNCIFYCAVTLNSSKVFLDLPERLKQEKKTKSPQNIYYRRLDSNGQFTTVMTHANPSTKGSTLLHPSQKRSITIREIARCQGFPDRYTFMTNFEPSEVRRAYKQIGNAVPQQLGLALGKSLGRAIITDWEKKEGSGREPTPDL